MPPKGIKRGHERHPETSSGRKRQKSSQRSECMSSDDELSTHTSTPVSASKKEVYPLSDKKFQQKLFHLVMGMDEKLDKLIHNSSADGKYPSTKIRQLDSARDLFEYDSKLMDDEGEEQAFINSISRIGGTSVENQISNILKR